MSKQAQATYEDIVMVVQAYEVGKPDSLVVVIPKSLRMKMGFKKGARFLLKTDARGRLVYEPIDKATAKIGEALDSRNL
jgi:hypothetical protein